MLLFWTFSSQNDPTVEVVELLSPARLFLFECLKHSLTTRDWSNDRSCNGSSESGPVLVPCGKNQLHGCILRDTRKDQHRHERKSWMSWINLDLQLTRMTKESGTMEGCMIMQCSCNSIAQVSAWWCQLSDDFPSSTFFSCRWAVLWDFMQDKLHPFGICFPLIFLKQKMADGATC